MADTQNPLASELLASLLATHGPLLGGADLMRALGYRNAAAMRQVRIPLMADSDSISIADSVPGDGGHVARVP